MVSNHQKAKEKFFEFETEEGLVSMFFEHVEWMTSIEGFAQRGTSIYLRGVS